MSFCCQNLHDKENQHNHPEVTFEQMLERGKRGANGTNRKPRLEGIHLELPKGHETIFVGNCSVSSRILCLFQIF